MRAVIKTYFIGAVLLSVVLSCGRKKAVEVGFRVLPEQETGITFSNTLKASPELNMFNYMYFYNGAGLGAGDFNQDGRIDLFFAGNQVANTLYLNEGELRFRDITAEAGIISDGGWSTGVSVVDINNDGRLDIYVCRVGSFGPLRHRNQLLINNGNRNGVPQFADSAARYGLDFSGFSTQAAFFDQDLDGDLDMYLMNHSLHHNGSFGERKVFTGTYDSLSGDRFYRNESGNYRDVTREIAINSSSIGYGLGIVVTDINLDGYPDLYIGNDFHENDYLYVNDGKGGFIEKSGDAMMHTSQFSMGVDIADINNDALPEIITMDMLPSDYNILKRSLGEDEYNVAQMKIRYGYQYQFTRNSLQYNRGNGQFSEIGLYSGVHATDWSWAPLWFDMDNDGYKDLFISNGIPKRLNDIDYVNYVSNDAIQQKIGAGEMGEKDMAIIDKFPQIRLKNKFFINDHQLRFRDSEKEVEGDLPGFSNVAVYAFLVNDGYLDIVVNNIDAPATVYHNTRKDSSNKSWQLLLKGPPGNLQGMGARVMLFAGDKVMTAEKWPVRGFLSSMEIPLQVSAGREKPDSALLIWPDGTCQSFDPMNGGRRQVFQWVPGLRRFNYDVLWERRAFRTPELIARGPETGIGFRHVENPYVDFNREPLAPNMLSTEGPALAVGDMNGDGLEDLFIGNARNQKPALYLQQADGRFRLSYQEALVADSAYEDISACWADCNADGRQDLVVVSGGNEFYGKDTMLSPRLYLNDGKGGLKKSAGAFRNIFLTAAVVRPSDINGDGYADLFIGGRAVSFEYGALPHSYLLLNNRNGGFEEVTSRIAPDLQMPGFVTDACWTDLDQDQDDDLLLSLEWGMITLFENKQGNFVKKELAPERGWWNMVLPFDADGDGDLDVLAGNLGLNSRLKASTREPVRLLYQDFDGNGRKETVLTYYHEGKERPFANKFELEKQIPVLKKKFLYAEQFAGASLEDLFGEEKIKSATVHTATHFATTLYINEGAGRFRAESMPDALQWAPCRSAVVGDMNRDGLADLVTAGNFYGSNIEMGRYDADYGSLLLNKGKGRFLAEPFHPKVLKGQVRNMQWIKVGGEQQLAVARNNDSLRLYQLGKWNQ